MNDETVSSDDLANLDVDTIPWIISKNVFNNQREHGYKLHPGDLLKLGKYLLKIREIKTSCDEWDRKKTFESGEVMKILNNNNNNNRHNHNNINVNVSNEHNSNENNNKENNNKENNNIDYNNNENNNKLIDISSNPLQNNNQSDNIHLLNLNENYVRHSVQNNYANNIDNIIEVSENDDNSNIKNDDNKSDFTPKYNVIKNINFLKRNSEQTNELGRRNKKLNTSCCDVIFRNKRQSFNQDCYNKYSYSFIKNKYINNNVKNTKISTIISQTDISNNRNKPICRICLCSEHDNINPLINPCECSGTMKYIHLECLRYLIKSKVKKTETENCKMFTFKSLECEICKTTYSEKVKLKNNKVYNILDFEKPEKEYITLDGFIKEAPKEKTIFIVYFKNNNSIKIGRASDANIRLSDISVSRAHALINKYNGDYYLNDTNSKFGTLISAGNKFSILNNKPFYIQKGKIYYHFLMTKTFCAMLTCYKPKFLPYINYNEFYDLNFLNKQQKDDKGFPKKTTRSVSEFDSNSSSINKKPTKTMFDSLVEQNNKLENKCININKNEDVEEKNKTQDKELNNINKSNIVSLFNRSNNNVSVNNMSNCVHDGNNMINDGGDDLIIHQSGNQLNNN